MHIQNRFELPVPPNESWTAVTDLPRVASCLPGAQITDVQPDGTHQGTVAVALGPASLSFAGEARIVDADPEAGRLVVRAAGGERRGRGRASARIQVSLSGVPSGTQVDVAADLELSGSVAQYGRRGGMLEDVSELLIEDFVAALREEILHGEPSDVQHAGHAGHVGTPVARPEKAAGPLDAGTLMRATPARSSAELSRLIPVPAPTPGSPASRAPRKQPVPTRQQPTRQQPTRQQPVTQLSALALTRRLMRRRLRRLIGRLRRRPSSSAKGPRS